MASMSSNPAGEDVASDVACCADRDHSIPWCPCDNHVRSNMHPYGKLSPETTDEWASRISKETVARWRR